MDILKELVGIYNALMTIETKGNNTVTMSAVLTSLKQIVEALNEERQKAIQAAQSAQDDTETSQGAENKDVPNDKKKAK